MSQLKNIILNMISEEILSENWGNLGKVIPSKLLTKFAKPREGRWDKTKSGVGQNSEYKDLGKNVTYTSITKALKDEGGRVVLFTDADNAIVIKVERETNRSSIVFKTAKNQTIKNAMREYDAKYKSLSPKAIISATINAFKDVEDELGELKAVILFDDKEMKETQKIRAKDRRGSIPLPSDKKSYSAYLSNARRDLEDRLSQFKALKIPNITNKSEFKELVENSYPEFVIVNDVRYERSNSSVYLFGDDPHIEYKRSRSYAGYDSTEYKEWVKRYYEDPNLDRENAFDDWKKLHPYSIKVILSLSGNVLKAVDVEWSN